MRCILIFYVLGSSRGHLAVLTTSEDKLNPVLFCRMFCNSYIRYRTEKERSLCLQFNNVMMNYGYL